MGAPLLLIAAIGGALYLFGGGRKPSWEKLRLYRGDPDLPDRTAKGILRATFVPNGAIFSVQDMFKAAVGNGYFAHVSTALDGTDSGSIALTHSEKPPEGFRLYAKAYEKLPALTTVDGKPAESGPIPPGASSIPRPDFWPDGVPWPLPIAQPPSSDAKRPDWLPGDQPWPQQGPLSLPADEQKAIDTALVENPPPGAEFYLERVGEYWLQSGGADKIAAMASEASDPTVKAWLAAVAIICAREAAARGVVATPRKKKKRKAA